MASTHFSAPSPPVFTGENYAMWSIKMKAYLQAFDLWEVTEGGMEPEPLRANPTVAQMKQHSEEVAKKFKALAAIHSSVSDTIFIRIMTCSTAKEAWNKLKEEFQGSARTRQMQVLNLRREFETLKMKESELVKEFTDRVLKVVNQIRVLGEELPDKRVVEKVLVSLPERFEAKISSLEESRDLNEISLSELINALQATEQRRTFRQEETMEGALFAKQNGEPVERIKRGKESFSKEGDRRRYGPCFHCKKEGHTAKYCWFRPNVQCKSCKQFGHVEKVCKRKGEYVQQANQAQETVEGQLITETLFAATCFTADSSKGRWILDSGCSNHMSFEEDLFCHLDKSITTRV